ncbi:unnamed protein product [Paramecium sonneborni]|uniref:Uncharacterized protein n=1 Tax=Paramecium sonneborni TaxID=65129 RepID=A0A8S1NH57_9CILI|nr:unnamed protein product [Paramecium sonneborni]
MSSSQNSYESGSTSVTNTEDQLKQVAWGVGEVLVKGTICGIAHLAVFTILRHSFIIDKIR